jgi:hypothetical protein
MKKTFAVIAFFGVVAAFGARAFALAGEAESQPTEAGIRAVEAHWQQAFMNGDTTYLDALLVPD